MTETAISTDRPVAGAGFRWTTVRTAPAGLVDDTAMALADHILSVPLRSELFSVPGRTAWVPTGTGAALKIKGIGLWPGGDAPVRPPCGTAFLRPRAHVGFTAAGGLRVVESAPAPLGGITLDRAECEFAAALAMCRSAPDMVRPVLLCRLVDPALRFPPGPAGSEYGVVVTAVPCRYPYRLDTVLAPLESLDPARRRFAAEVRRGRGLLETVVSLSGGFGAALRTFTEAGFFRHSGTVDNWGIQPGTGRVFLTDLDSSRPLSEVGRENRPLEVLRDVASGIFGLAAALMAPGLDSAGADPADATAAFRRLAGGYFAGAADAVVADAVAPFIRYWVPLARRSWAGFGARPPGHARAIWMDRDLAYCLLLHGLADAYGTDAAARQWGVPDADRLTEASRAFLGPGRACRLDALLAG